VQLFVPLSSDSGRWGSFELTYVPDGRSALQRALGQPLWVALLATAVLGAGIYFQYMRRALVHLDPRAVIPERVKLAFDIMTEGVVVLDRRGRVLLANRAFCALSPDRAADVVGRPLSSVAWLAAGLPADAAMHPWERAMQAGSPEMGCTLEVATADSGDAKVVVNCAPITDLRGAVRGCVATFADLTALHLANERLSAALAELSTSRDEIARKNVELERMANHDVLTGCLTRGAFLVRMAQARVAAQRNSSAMACLALDIDRFKVVNDNFGHTIGDRVIEVVGKALLASLRPADIAGRYGGDEFFVGMLDCDLDEGIAVAEKIRRTVEDRCRADFAHVAGLAITVSVGVAALCDGDEELGDLIDRADGALYRAKADGRNRIAAAPRPAVHT
jgi:diguanylate cyclase (GGDEF)-like protein/PAS domain S-box-containing protein